MAVIFKPEKRENLLYYFRVAVESSSCACCALARADAPPSPTAGDTQALIPNAKINTHTINANFILNSLNLLKIVMLHDLRQTRKLRPFY
jgi:hypothetical protein